MVFIETKGLKRSKEEVCQRNMKMTATDKEKLAYKED